MDKLIAVSTYDKKAHKAFYKFHMLKKSKSTYFIYAVCLMMVGLAVSNTIEAPNITNITFSWTLAAFTILLAPTLIFWKVNSIVNQEADQRKDLVETIEINKVRIERKSEKGRIIYNWSDIESIYEQEEYIFIYVGEKTGMLVIKKDIKEGSVEDLEKLALKYMNKNKKGKVKYKKNKKVIKA
ncbi:MAG: YcxB family protein [Bacilli bacterium]|nr:YcxB family protein [Bacilli bacterium]